MLKNTSLITKSLEQIPTSITYIVALSKGDEERIAAALHEHVRFKPKILVCDVHDMLNMSAGQATGSLEKIVYIMMQEQKNKKLDVPGRALARLLASSITFHLNTQEHIIEHVYIVGAPHNHDQVAPLHAISPNAKLIYVGHSRSHTARTPYHTSIMKAVTEMVGLSHPIKEIVPENSLAKLMSEIVSCSNSRT